MLIYLFFMTETLDKAAPPAVALVVLNWNGAELIDTCLASLVNQSYPNFSLIVVDNGSQDESADVIKRRFPHVQVIQNSHNLGFTRGMNVGLQAALDQHFDLIVTLNNDVSAAADWLERFVDPIVENPKIGVAGCKLLYPDEVTIQHAGATMTVPLAHNRHYFQYEKDVGQADEPRDVDYVTGAAMGIRRPVLLEIGLLDESYGPFYYEEVDFCYRARSAGWRVVYLPQAQAIHHESYSVGQLGLNHQRYYQQNRLLFVGKQWSKARFTHEFLPAEKAALASETSYHTAALVASAARREQGRWADHANKQYLVEGFQELAKAADRAKTRLMPLRLPPTPPLTQWSFASNVPVVGPLISRFRKLWHNVAARWYTDHALKQVAQTEAQLAAHNQQLLEMIHGLSHDIAVLQDEVTRLRQTATPQQGVPQSEDQPGR